MCSIASKTKNADERKVLQMAQLMDHITYLSKEIGPRPAGTEEEQKAALYITEQFQKETGFGVDMEDFSSSSNVEAGLAVMAGVVVVVTVLAMIFPVLTIPAFILGVAAAVVYSLEEFDKPIISRVLSRGASQNVVAKYQPSNAEANKGSRRGSSRKIVLLAHYDTSNVTPPIVDRVESSPIPVALVCVAGIIAAAFFLLVRIFVAGGGGMGLLVLNVLSIIVLIICLYPIAKALLIRTSPYNEGATNNATGSAALIEIARRISHGSVSEAELAEAAGDDVVIHGEEAARAAGLIPEGVQLVYEAEALPPVPEIDEYDEEERLLSAKAAIAALTGQPVERKVYSSFARSQADPIPGEGEGFIDEGFAPEYGDFQREEDFAYAEMGEVSPDVYGAKVDEEPEAAEGFENAPSWFVAAQQNARKSENERAGSEPQIKRSRYTEAIESAERSLAQREEEIKAAKRAEREAAQRAREEEFRALMAAREAERAAASRAAIEQQEAAFASQEPLQEPVVASVDAGQQVNQDLGSTMAMPMHTPSAEIIAEALAADAAESTVQQVSEISEEPSSVEPSPVSLDASEIPIPPVEEMAQSRIAAIPSIDPADPYSSKPAEESRPSLAEQIPSVQEPAAKEAPVDTSDPSKSSILRRLRTSIPSLSGLLSPVDSPKGSVTRRSSSNDVDYSMEVPLDAASVPSISPVSNNSVVEIPRSRSGSLINRMRRPEEEALSDTPQQWLDVDQNFDPRSAGRDRGGWESFRPEEAAGERSGNVDASSEEVSTPDIRRRWQGGAYSRVQLGHVSTLSGEDAEADTPIEEELVELETERPIAEEIEQIYHFRNPQFNMEIWFVAIGSDGESHDGARAFVEEHRDELRGAMMIEIESLGAGSLSVAKEEGRVRKVTVSSRVKRFTRAATAATGLALDSVSLAGKDSIASTLQKAGFQAMHLFGAEDGRPALKGSADDVVENVDELALEEHVSYVYELLKS